MKVLIVALILSYLSVCGQVSAAEVNLGVVPQQSASKLARLWSPIAAYLSEKSGHTVRFVTAKDITTFETRLAAGDYDLAYMNPYHYTVFSRAPGYQAFARQKDKRIKGIVVVRKDSPLSSLKALDGQSLAFPSPAAFAASVLPRSQLRLEGISFKPEYVSSHDSVYLAVARGFFPAGGGVMRTFKNTDPAVQAQLKVLWNTKTYTPHALASHPRVPSSVIDDILSALLDMNSDPQGKLLLKEINFNGMQAAEDSDWDDVRGLGIDLLADLVE